MKALSSAKRCFDMPRMLKRYGWALLLLGIWETALRGDFSDAAQELPAFDANTVAPSELPLFEEIPVVVTASKKPERITAAPSIISVITQEDIERMGARTIMDVLRAIPGMEVVKDSDGVSQVIVRGLGVKDSTDGSTGVKILIDGHALNDPFLGSATRYYDDMSLFNVRRIEVIRGPASAIYGANAFVSVVNIITKRAQEIGGLQTSLGVGSAHTYHPAFLFGKILNELEVVLSAEYMTTSGDDMFIARDLASIFDVLSTTAGIAPSSRAPMTYHEHREKVDVSWKIRWADVTFQGKTLQKERSPFLTTWYMANDSSQEEEAHWYADLGYQRYLTERVEFSGRLYVDQFELSQDQTVAPGIALYNHNQGTFTRYPDGLTLNASEKSQRFGAEGRLYIRLFNENDLTVGAAYEYFLTSNFTMHTNLLQSDSEEYMSGLQTRIADSSYQHFASIFAQDSWRLHRDVDLTLGMRGDYFNDFGGIFTPKIGLTYEPNQSSLNFKLLFGTAFRVPSFYEVMFADQDDTQGNLFLEELRTFEAGVGYKPADWLLGEMNYFYSDINQLVQSDDKDAAHSPVGTTRVYDNVSGIDAQGVEVELRGTREKEVIWGKFPRAFGATFRVNYSYLDAQDATTHETVPYVARHKGNLGVGFLLAAAPKKARSSPHLFRIFNDELSLYANLLLLGERPRHAEDSRSPLSGQAVIDMTLAAHDVYWKGLDISISCNNLLNKEYSDPSPSISLPPDFDMILSDIPLPGRSLFVEITWTF